MANRWGKNENNDRYFLGLQNHCGQWLQPWNQKALLKRKAMIDLGSIVKSRDITLSTEVHIVKALIFPTVMYGHESWTVKKAEGWRIDAFKLWCWRRLLRVLWTVRRSSLKEINPEYSLGGLMLKLKGAIEDEMVGWHQRLNGHKFEETLGDSERQGSLVYCSPWGPKESDS